jgi:hypothetical protein
MAYSLACSRPNISKACWGSWGKPVHRVPAHPVLKNAARGLFLLPTYSDAVGKVNDSRWL